VMSFMDWTTPGTTWVQSGYCYNREYFLTSCSIPLYSPSVFSLISTVSTLSYLVLYPCIDLQGRRLAYKLNVRRSVKFRETCPLPIGVASGPSEMFNMTQ